MNRHIFQIGEKVVALNTSKKVGAQSRIKGKSYMVNNISYCIACGAQRINHGDLPVFNTGSVYCTCNSKQSNNGLA